MPVEWNFWKTWKEIANGDQDNIDSKTIGKKDNSNKKPLPNRIRISIVINPSNITDRVSIITDKNIKKLPKISKYTDKQTPKNKNVTKLKGMDVKVE